MWSTSPFDASNYGSGGVVILARQHLRLVMLSEDGLGELCNSGRVLTCAVLGAADEICVRVMAVYGISDPYSHATEVRQMWAKLNEVLATWRGCDHMLVGDLNCHPEHEVIATLQKQFGLTDSHAVLEQCPRRPTFKDNTVLDYVFLSPSLVWQACDVATDEELLFPSHRVLRCSILVHDQNEVACAHVPSRLPFDSKTARECHRDAQRAKDWGYLAAEYADALQNVTDETLDSLANLWTVRWEAYLISWLQQVHQARVDKHDGRVFIRSWC